MRAANHKNQQVSQRDSSRGAAAIEFALILPILIMLLFGIIEFGRAYNAKLTLGNAAREAAREYVITGNDDLLGVLVSNLETTLSGVTMVVTDNCAEDPPHVLASASSDFAFNLPLVASGNMDLTETVVMRCVG